MFMFANFLYFAVAIAQAEVGLIIRSTNADIDEKPVRLFDDQLSIDTGPIFQAYFDTDEHLIISDHLISKNHTGAGLGVTDIKQLVVSQDPSTSFYARGGWLEHGANAVFFAEKDDDGWKLFTSPGDTSMRAVPAMLQIADIAYESHKNGTSTSQTISVDEPASTELEDSVQLNEFDDEYIYDDMENYDYEPYDNLIEDDLHVPESEQAVVDSVPSAAEASSILSFVDNASAAHSTRPTSVSERVSSVSLHKAFDTEFSASSLLTKTEAQQQLPTLQPTLLATHNPNTQLTSYSQVNPNQSKSETNNYVPASSTRRVITRYATATNWQTFYAPIPTVTETIRVPIYDV